MNLKDLQDMIERLKEALARVDELNETQKQDPQVYPLLYQIKSLASQVYKKLPDVKLIGERLRRLREIYPNSHKAWTKEEEDILTKHFQEGISTHQIGKLMGRSSNGIFSRLVRLGLVELKPNLQLKKPCSICGNESGDDEDLEGNPVCVNCAQENGCYLCGSFIDVDEAETDQDGYPICNACAEDKDLSRDMICEECGEEVTVDAGDAQEFNPDIDDHCPSCGGLLLPIDRDK